MTQKTQDMPEGEIVERSCGNCGHMTDEQELYLDVESCNEPVCPSCIGVYGTYDDGDHIAAYYNIVKKGE